MGGVARAVDADAGVFVASVQSVAAAVDPEQDLVVVVADQIVQRVQFFGQPVGLGQHDEVVLESKKMRLNQ